MTKCIANRIFPLLPSIINEDQTGFIKGRFIGENIRLIDDLLLYTKREQIEGLLLQLDFEKAFDSIEWSFIYKTLREFNFGPNISSWIKLCYTEIFSTIINKGSTCGWFSLHRGVRQGCPLSTILFILCVEILAEIIRTNNEIKGIVINGKELKLSQYADDTTSILGTVESVFELFRITLLFEKKSGLRLNKSKTLLIWLGPWRKRKDTVQNLMVCDSSFNNLGIELGYDQKQCDQKNFNSKISKMNIKYNIWKTRDLSILGKILIAKSLGISNLVYSLSNSISSITHIKDSQKLTNDFIWNNRPAKIKHSTLINDYDKGGLKAPDIQCMQKSLRLVWIGRIIQKSKWATVANYYFSKMGGLSFLLHCNFDVQHLPYIPPFYCEMLSWFQEIFPPNDIAKYVIWNNKDIVINGKSLFWKSFF